MRLGARATGGRSRAGIPLLAALLLLAGACSKDVFGSVTQPSAPATTGAPAGPPLTITGNASTTTASENAKPGSTGWQITGTQKPGGIAGFADQASAAVGDHVGLFVSTAAPTFHVEAYRMGWYGGDRGRLVWTSSTVPGRVQAAPVVAPATHTVSAPWDRTLTVIPDSTWTPGDYLLKLVGSDGAQSYVPLTVRDDRSAAAYVIMNAVTTWQAYNRWGGFSLYAGQDGSYASRARVVSFDRPYDFGDGAADFVGNELPLVALAERLGLDVTYWTDVDLHEHPERLLAHKALISLGHDEYWSTAMRDGAEAAVRGGVNLAFLGANAAYRHIRLEATPLGSDRLVVCYKSAAEDPLRKTDPADVTVDWRDPPTNRPESMLVGGFYQCNPVRADMVITDPAAWIWDGTGVRGGDRLPGVVGNEYDRAGTVTPAPVHSAASSPVTCRGKRDHADVTWYAAPSGAVVVDTGTSAWVGYVGAGCSVEPCPGRVITAATTNVLSAFGRGPAAAPLGLLAPPALVATPAPPTTVAPPRPTPATRRRTRTTRRR